MGSCTGPFAPRLRGHLKQNDESGGGRRVTLKSHIMWFLNETHGHDDHGDGHHDHGDGHHGRSVAHETWS
eukprot:1145692-Pyramimonas_sp.AAC.1